MVNWKLIAHKLVIARTENKTPPFAMDYQVVLRNYKKFFVNYKDVAII